MGLRLALALLLVLGLGRASAQNRDHPGLVHLGDGAWGTPEQAAEAGLIEHGGRWFPKQLASKLKKWERLDAKGLEWDDAYKEKTKYYRVKTNVPRFVFELEIRPFLDELGDTYTRVFEEDFGLEGKAVKNKDLKIYGSFEDYSRHEPDGGQARPRTNPGFIINGAELVVFYEETDPEGFYSTVFHEGAHQFFLSLLPGASLPIWLDEALATWFEGATYSRATGKITFGAVPVSRLRSAQRQLRSKQGTPEELFMSVPQERFTADHYALAWSFLHFLVERPGKDNAKRFARFLRETNGSGVKPIAEVFEEATGEDLAELSKGWREHVQALAAPEEVTEWVQLMVVRPHGEAKEEPAVEIDVADGDVIWSVNGVAVFSADEFEALWRQRPEDRPTRLVLIRGEPSFTDRYSRRSFVSTEVPPDSKLDLIPRGMFNREGNLRD